MMRSSSATAKTAVAMVLGGAMLLVAGCKVTTVDTTGIPPYDQCTIGRTDECSQ
jgi:hypothetical protein